ncbi:hypothetical protein WJX73_010581 [Symbiochloris irregularis]|uniref:SET domain-containing protein n=1 Tax=Symbiochloris irregularis TaxID=706552 RepID=A0AAW1PEC8_9CHLO
MDALTSWLSSLTVSCPGTPVLSIKLKQSKATSIRGLTAATAVSEGGGLASVDWKAAITAETALLRLKQFEAAGSGLLPRGISHFLQLAERNSYELPESCAWTCLVALQLLAEMRDTRTELKPYIQLLPSPPGTLIKTICSQGPNANDLLLFSLPELLELQVVPVWAAVLKEQQRLSSLHRLLFCTDAAGVKVSSPVISRESFIWAHCLVRSRVLELCRSQRPSQATCSSLHAALRGLQLPECMMDRQGSTRCMLPLIDLCNHAPRGQDTCKLGLQFTPDRTARAVTLDAKRAIEEDEPLTLDYGNRPMRDMLRNYGFCADSGFEVFEEVGDMGWSLIVRGTTKASCFRLTEVHIYAAGEGEPLLEMAGASLCFLSEMDRRGSMQSLTLSCASSHDSLDDLLAEFEVGLLPGLQQVDLVSRQPVLRKRDFESELLDRLLNDTSSAQGFSTPVKPPVEAAPLPTPHHVQQAQAFKSSFRRSIGMHRILFITTVFAIMGLFLLLFTNGRMHAQRAMRQTSAVNLLPLMPSVPLVFTPPDSLEGDASSVPHAKHHHTAQPQHISLPNPIRTVEEFVASGKAATEDVRQHERSSSRPPPLAQHPQPSQPLRLLDRKQRSSIGLKLMMVR